MTAPPCPIHDLELEDGSCPECGWMPVRPRNEDDELDRLVEAASVPNLANLYRKAKEEGLIPPAPAYH